MTKADLVQRRELRALQRAVEEFVRSECDQVVRDMTHHVGDEVHAVLKRHGMLLRSAGAGAGLACLAAIQVFAEGVEFMRNSVDTPEERDAVTAAFVSLFLSELPNDLAASLRARAAMEKDSEND